MPHSVVQLIKTHEKGKKSYLSSHPRRTGKNLAFRRRTIKQTAFQVSSRFRRFAGRVESGSKAEQRSLGAEPLSSTVWQGCKVVRVERRNTVEGGLVRQEKKKKRSSDSKNAERAEKLERDERSRVPHGKDQLSGPKNPKNWAQGEGPLVLNPKRPRGKTGFLPPTSETYESGRALHLRKEGKFDLRTKLFAKRK